MKLKVGQVLHLNGSNYTVIGVTGRSVLFQGATKQAKATLATLLKLTGVHYELPDVKPSEQESEISKRVRLDNALNGSLKPPVTKAECQAWFNMLEYELAPERLAADGERSHSEIKKYKESIIRCWREVEAVAGCKRIPHYRQGDRYAL
jgi:hypothetical protein